MRPTLSLIHRELSAYFLSPLPYFVIGCFMASTGYLFYYFALEPLTAEGPQGINFPMQLIVSKTQFWLVFLLIPPLLTMRLFAEERSTGTLEMLLTSPLRDWQIVLSKFLACLTFYCVMWLPTLLFLPVLTDWQWWTLQCGIDPWPIVSTYLGLFLAGGMFLALGMFVSSLVKSQMVAALVALFISMVFIIAGFWRPELDSGTTIHETLFFFTVPMHFERNFSRGLVDTRQLILYISAALFFLFLTVRSLESRRWR